MLLDAQVSPVLSTSTAPHVDAAELTLNERAPPPGTHPLAPQPPQDNRLLPPYAVQQTHAATEAAACTRRDDDRAPAVEEGRTQRDVRRAEGVALHAQGRIRFRGEAIGEGSRGPGRVKGARSWVRVGQVSLADVQPRVFEPPV